MINPGGSVYPDEAVFSRLRDQLSGEFWKFLPLKNWNG